MDGQAGFITTDFSDTPLLVGVIIEECFSKGESDSGRRIFFSGRRGDGILGDGALTTSLVKIRKALSGVDLDERAGYHAASSPLVFSYSPCCCLIILQWFDSFFKSSSDFAQRFFQRSCGVLSNDFRRFKEEPNALRCS